MDAATASNEQIKRYRRMTGEQRLTVALDLHEMSCDIAHEGIRRQNPKANAAEVERLLRHRIELERNIKPTVAAMNARWWSNICEREALLGAVSL